jgi:hypothetical protein
MEAALPFLEQALLVALGTFALYQCFNLPDGRRPALAWTARTVLIVLAGVCFFTVARFAASR